ncbi:hypothetical protein MWU77_10210 [Rhodococcus sp. F64268]|uniref:hypothetical protein n=1 Tax=Rhodococcus sp. F64268 TaxID=2926402 RepID=UPI001FF375EA|nr:hypothetical protein [Rhodococcus sp. F64268]MCK0091153.1 hypothetical protein [Rhodococcus sp. F64268]
MAETLAVSAEIHTVQVQRVDLMIAMFERETVKDHGYRSPAHWLCAATNLELGECTASKHSLGSYGWNRKSAKPIHPACSMHRRHGRSPTSASTIPAP